MFNQRRQETQCSGGDRGSSSCNSGSQGGSARVHVPYDRYKREVLRIVWCSKVYEIEWVFTCVWGLICCKLLLYSSSSLTMKDSRLPTILIGPVLSSTGAT